MFNVNLPTSVILEGLKPPLTPNLPKKLPSIEAIYVPEVRLCFVGLLKCTLDTLVLRL